MSKDFKPEELILSSTGGMKCDKMKDRWDLAPWDSFEQIVKIMTYGAQKYEPNNWQKVEFIRYFAAFMRHFMALLKGEYLDPESGYPHSSHMACNAVFMNSIDLRNHEVKDNGKNIKPTRKQRGN